MMQIRLQQYSLICSYCHAAAAGDSFICDGCHTCYHAECFTELGRCGTLGCGKQVSNDKHQKESACKVEALPPEEAELLTNAIRKMRRKDARNRHLFDIFVSIFMLLGFLALFKLILLSYN